MRLKLRSDKKLDAIELRRYCYCGDAPSAPDPNPGMIRMAEVSERLGDRYLDMAQEQYADTKTRNDDMWRVSKDVLQTQLGIMRKNDQLADEYQQHQTETFRPIEKRIAQEAMNFDTEAEQEAAASRAAADVLQAYDRNREQLGRTLRGLGIKRNSGAALTALGAAGADQAEAEAGARNKARENVKLVGRALRADAANLGRGIASSQATSAGVSLNASNAAVQNQNATSAQMTSNTDASRGWFNSALGAYGQAGNIYGQEFNARMQGWSAANAADAQSSSGMGSLVGMLGSAAINKWSSKKLKTDQRPVSDEDVLEEIKALPVERWRYRRGVADEGEHIGPYAEDVQARLGDEAAPGGKQINLGALNEANLAAIRALVDKAERLEREVAGLRKGRSA